MNMRLSANYCWASRPSLSLIATICYPTQGGESHLSPSLSLRGFAICGVLTKMAPCSRKHGLLYHRSMKCVQLKKHKNHYLQDRFACDQSVSRSYDFYRSGLSICHLTGYTRRRQTEQIVIGAIAGMSESGSSV